jgi:hypothetical protein
MTVKELMEKLKELPPDSVVGFSWFGNHPIERVKVGKEEGQTTGYVLFYTKSP